MKTNHPAASTPHSKADATQLNSDFGILGLGLLHDIANPMTAIILGMERLNADIHNVQSIILTAQQHISQTGQAKRFRLAPEVRRIANQVSKNAADPVKIILDIPADLSLRCSLFKFQLIINNLLTNAVEAYEPGQFGKPIKVTATSTDRGVRIVIRDYGRGLSPAQIKQIVQPFYSTKQGAIQHFGLGLTITRHLITEDLGGSLTIHGSAGKGCRFTIVLPAAANTGS